MDKDSSLLVNMPDCTNLFFEFDRFGILNSKRIADKNSKEAIPFYNLSGDIQGLINTFLNPEAILKNNDTFQCNGSNQPLISRKILKIRGRHK